MKKGQTRKFYILGYRAPFMAVYNLQRWCRIQNVKQSIDTYTFTTTCCLYNSQAPFLRYLCRVVLLFLSKYVKNVDTSLLRIYLSCPTHLKATIPLFPAALCIRLFWAALFSVLLRSVALLGLLLLFFVFLHLQPISICYRLHKDPFPIFLCLSNRVLLTLDLSKVVCLLHSISIDLSYSWPCSSVCCPPQPLPWALYRKNFSSSDLQPEFCVGRTQHTLKLNFSLGTRYQCLL